MWSGGRVGEEWGKSRTEGVKRKRIRRMSGSRVYEDARGSSPSASNARRRYKTSTDEANRMIDDGGPATDPRCSIKRRPSDRNNPPKRPMQHSLRRQYPISLSPPSSKGSANIYSYLCVFLSLKRHIYTTRTCILKAHYTCTEVTERILALY